MEFHPRNLEIEEQLLDLGGGIDLDRGRQQMLSLPNVADKDRLAHEPQGEPRIVSLDRSIERWIAIAEIHGKAEFGRKEIADALISEQNNCVTVALRIGWVAVCFACVVMA